MKKKQRKRTLRQDVVRGCLDFVVLCVIIYALQVVLVWFGYTHSKRVLTDPTSSRTVTVRIKRGTGYPHEYIPFVGLLFFPALWHVECTSGDYIQVSSDLDIPGDVDLNDFRIVVGKRFLRLVNEDDDEIYLTVP